jgi:FdhD protein
MAEDGASEMPVQRWEEGELNISKDSLVKEQALNINVQMDGEVRRLAVTMRTPGDEVELGVGWLLSEGLIQSSQDVLSCSFEGDAVTIELADGSVDDLAQFVRPFPISSGCGLCGRETLENFEIPSRLALSGEPWLSPTLLMRLPKMLSSSQPVFQRTGGLHAAALFDTDGGLTVIKEDVGRHNALDKLVGSRLLASTLPAENEVLMLSGRIGYELIQKAAYAGIPAVAGLGAPTTMAVEAARASGLTLVGFLRSDRFNVHTGAWRLLKN